MKKSDVDTYFSHLAKVEPVKIKSTLAIVKIKSTLKSYSPVCELPVTYQKNGVHQRDASALLLQTAASASGWSVMASDKSAAKMGQNSSMWTHTRRPIRRGKITEMLFIFARNNKIYLS